MQSTICEVAFTETPNIDGLVKRLRDIHRTSKLMLAVDVGCLVVLQLYNGDVQTLHKTGRTHDGFRKLADHPDLPMSKSTLWRYVRVYELTSRMPWIVPGKLTVAHLTLVLGVEPDEQERLLRMAEDQGWSSARLSKELRTKEPTIRPTLPVLKVVRRAERLEADPRQFGRVRDLGEEERRRVREAVERTRAWCEAVDAWLRDGGEVN